MLADIMCQKFPKDFVLEFDHLRLESNFVKTELEKINQATSYKWVNP